MSNFDGRRHISFWTCMYNDCISWKNDNYSSNNENSGQLSCTYGNMEKALAHKRLEDSISHLYLPSVQCSSMYFTTPDKFAFTFQRWVPELWRQHPLVDCGSSIIRFNQRLSSPQTACRLHFRRVIVNDAPLCRTPSTSGK